MRSLAALLVISGAATAQVTVQALADTDLVVHATSLPSPPAEQRISQGSDVTAGYSLSVTVSGGATGTARSSASSALTIAHGTASSVVDLRESAQGGFDLLGGQASASFGSHRLRVVYRSPVAVPASLRIECCSGASQTIGGYSGRVEVNGVTRLVAAGASPVTCFFGAYPQQATVPVTLGPGGPSIVLDTSGWATGSLRGGSGMAVVRFRLTVTPNPDFPCTVTSYGAACGATLQSTADLRYPGMHLLTLDDPSLPPLAWIAIGSARASTPFSGCTLRTDNALVARWPIAASGQATVLFRPPPGWSGAITAQGLTFGATLHASAGLEFVCP